MNCVSRVLTFDNTIAFEIDTDKYSEEQIFSIGDKIADYVLECIVCNDIETDNVQVSIGKDKVTVSFDLMAYFYGYKKADGHITFSENGEFKVSEFTKLVEDSLDMIELVWEDVFIPDLEPLDGEISYD